jgi:hypothetical protein
MPVQFVKVAGKEKWLDPTQVTPSPEISISYKENHNKNHHLDESKEPQVFKNHRPWKHERYFHIKNQEDEGDEIKSAVETNPRIANGNFTTFIWFVFLGDRFIPRLEKT